MAEHDPGPAEMDLYFSETSKIARRHAWTRGRLDCDDSVTDIAQFDIRELREAYAKGWLSRQREEGA